MTDIIQELRGLIELATPRPWEYLNTSGTIVQKIDRLTTYVIAEMQTSNETIDAALIVAAINHLPALLDRLEAAERGVDFLDMRRPINGIERRSKEEVFAIMADRIRLAEAGHYRLPAIREVKP